MSKVKKIVSRYNDALDNFAETISAIEFMQPQGDGARDQASKELDDACNRVIAAAKNVKNYIKEEYLED